MKIILTLLLATISLFAFTQKQTSTIEIKSGITITGTIEKFNLAKHTLDTCNKNSTYMYICKIDGQKWYGSDMGLDLPRNQLTSLIIHINQLNIPLTVSGMFNPRFIGTLSKNQFRLKKRRNDYILYAYFSDGAGSYTAWWTITNGKSKRILISSDEKYFSWQFEK